ncbi:hypothetical protein OG21DRAFT_1512208, partial [Imleria badia]
MSLLYQNVIFDSQHPDQTHVPGSQKDGHDRDGTEQPCSPAPAPPLQTPPEPPPFSDHPDHSFKESTRRRKQHSHTVSRHLFYRFPNFQFSMRKVTYVSSLYIAAKSKRGSRRVNVLLAALEVHGPDTILMKKGSDCKLTTFRDIADAAGMGSPGL